MFLSRLLNAFVKYKSISELISLFVTALAQSTEMHPFTDDFFGKLSCPTVDLELTLYSITTKVTMQSSHLGVSILSTIVEKRVPTQMKLTQQTHLHRNN